MVKLDKNEIIYVIIAAIISPIFSWMFSALTESLNPIIIIYSILSTLGVMIIFLGVEKLLIVIYKRGINWLEFNKYNKDVSNIAKNFKDLMVSKEIYIAAERELGVFLDQKIKIYKPSKLQIDIYNPRALKGSTLDVLNEMITQDFLIYIESMRLLLLKEKMVCKTCGSKILFHDKINIVEAKCQDCSEEYRITPDGLWHVHKKNGMSSYIRIKNLSGLRY